MTTDIVNTYLTKEISLFQSARESTPVGITTVKAFLDDCKYGKYRPQIERLRAEPDKSKRDALKKRLHAVTIQSEPCDKRNKESCTNNSIVCLDFDGIENIAELKRHLLALPYVLAVFTSASGNGLVALCALDEPAMDLKPVLEAIQKDIECPIDMSGSDISRLRFATYDPI